MSIGYFLEKIKPFYTALLCIVLASISFAFWRIYRLEERTSPVKINYPNASGAALVIGAASDVSATSSSGAPLGEDGVIGSKTGTKYYFPWCGTVKRIKPENQIHFSSREEAEKAGYTPGGNCKGLE